MMYNINKNDERLCALVQKNETDYLIQKRICELGPNSFIVSSQNWFDVEIDAVENGKLVEKLNKKVLTKFLRNRQYRKINGELGNLYLTLKVFKVNFIRWKKIYRQFIALHLHGSINDSNVNMHNIYLVATLYTLTCHRGQLKIDRYIIQKSYCRQQLQYSSLYVWKVSGDVMMLFGRKSLFGLTNLGQKLKGPRSLVERKQSNILASIDVTALGKYGQLQSLEKCEVFASFYVLGQVKSSWTLPQHFH